VKRLRPGQGGAAAAKDACGRWKFGSSVVTLVLLVASCSALPDDGASGDPVWDELRPKRGPEMAVAPSVLLAVAGDVVAVERVGAGDRMVEGGGLAGFSSDLGRWRPAAQRSCC